MCPTAAYRLVAVALLSALLGGAPAVALAQGRTELLGVAPEAPGGGPAFADDTLSAVLGAPGSIPYEYPRLVEMYRRAAALAGDVELASLPAGAAATTAALRSAAGTHHHVTTGPMCLVVRHDLGTSDSPNTMQAFADDRAWSFKPVGAGELGRVTKLRREPLGLRIVVRPSARGMHVIEEPHGEASRSGALPLEAATTLDVEDALPLVRSGLAELLGRMPAALVVATRQALLEHLEGRAAEGVPATNAPGNVVGAVRECMSRLLADVRREGDQELVRAAAAAEAELRVRAEAMEREAWAVLMVPAGPERREHLLGVYRRWRADRETRG